MQRCILRRRAGVAGYQVERMHRDVQLVAVRVFEMQEFCDHAACVQRGQPVITTNTILGMDDR